jgi:hypothetical protein
VFLVNRFDDTNPASIITRLNNERGFDRLDGSIQTDIAEILQQMAVYNACTIVLTTIAQTEDQICARRVARILGQEQGAFIALDGGDITDDWYSATVTTGAVEKRYGPLDFAYCPTGSVPGPTQSASAQLPCRPVVVPAKAPDVPAGPRQSWLRRLLG